MIINTELYRTFYVVAQEGSITKAAELLYITQPAVSRAIQQLEEKSGCALFFRTPKGVKLTKEGQVLYQYIEQAFNFIYLGEKKLSEVKELQKGEVTVGASDTICKHYLLPRLKNFIRTFPGVRIHIANHTTPVIMDMLKQGRIDLGIANLPIDDDDFTVKKTMEIQDCFIVGEKFKELAMEEHSISEIIKYPILLLEKGSNSRNYIDKYLAQNQIVLQPEIELGNIDLLVRFTANNFGVACVIRDFVLEELESSVIYEIMLKEPIPPRHVGIIHLKTVPLSAASKRLLSYLMP